MNTVRQLTILVPEDYYHLLLVAAWSSGKVAVEEYIIQLVLAELEQAKWFTQTGDSMAQDLSTLLAHSQAASRAYRDFCKMIESKDRLYPAEKEAVDRISKRYEVLAQEMREALVPPQEQPCERD
jgi:hypothetical protein